MSKKEAIERGIIQADATDVERPDKPVKTKVVYRTLPPVPYPVPDKRMTVGRAVAFIIVWFIGFAMGLMWIR